MQIILHKISWQTANSLQTTLRQLLFSLRVSIVQITPVSKFILFRSNLLEYNFQLCSSAYLPPLNTLSTSHYISVFLVSSYLS